MTIRAVDMLTNLKNWPAWDYKGYKLNEDESKPIIKALDNYIWHVIDIDGFPKKEGHYLVKHIDAHKRYDVAYMDGNGQLFSNFDMHEIYAWRNIIDEGDE